jgi:hypothetical protein
MMRILRSIRALCRTVSSASVPPAEAGSRAPERSAPPIWRARSPFTPVRSASCRSVSRRSAPDRSAPASCARERSAPPSRASSSRAPVRSAARSDACRRSARLRSHPWRCAPSSVAWRNVRAARSSSLNPRRSARRESCSHARAFAPRGRRRAPRRLSSASHARWAATRPSSSPGAGVRGTDGASPSGRAPVRGVWIRSSMVPAGRPPGPGGRFGDGLPAAADGPAYQRRRQDGKGARRTSSLMGGPGSWRPRARQCLPRARSPGARGLGARVPGGACPARPPGIGRTRGPRWGLGAPVLGGACPARDHRGPGDSALPCSAVPAPRARDRRGPR